MNLRDWRTELLDRDDRPRLDPRARRGRQRFGAGEPGATAAAPMVDAGVTGDAGAARFAHSQRPAYVYADANTQSHRDRRDSRRRHPSRRPVARHAGASRVRCAQHLPLPRFPCDPLLTPLSRLPPCVIPLAKAFDFTNLSCNTVYVRICCCCCIIFVMPKFSPTRRFLDAYWCLYAYTRPLSPTHLHEEASAQARVDSPAEKPSGTKPTGLGTRTGS